MWGVFKLVGDGVKYFIGYQRRVISTPTDFFSFAPTAANTGLVSTGCMPTDPNPTAQMYIPLNISFVQCLNLTISLSCSWVSFTSSNNIFLISTHKLNWTGSVRKWKCQQLSSLLHRCSFHSCQPVAEAETSCYAFFSPVSEGLSQVLSVDRTDSSSSIMKDLFLFLF